MQITIERAVPSEAAEILELMKVIGSESDNLSFGKEGLPVTVEQETEYLSGIAGSDRELFITARRDGELVGTAHYTAFTRKRMAHRGEIGICLCRSACGAGIGSRMMERLLDFAAHTAKSEIVSLEVRCDNTAAIALYRKYGFEKIGCFHGFFKISGELIDFDIMEKVL